MNLKNAKKDGFPLSPQKSCFVEGVDEYFGAVMFNYRFLAHFSREKSKKKFHTTKGELLIFNPINQPQSSKVKITGCQVLFSDVCSFADGGMDALSARKKAQKIFVRLLYGRRDMMLETGSSFFERCVKKRIAV